MPPILVNLLLLLAFCLLGGPSVNCLALPRSKSEILAHVKSLSEQNRNRLQEIDHQIRQGLMQTYNEDLSKKEIEATAADMARRESELERLTLQRKEHLLRQDFLDRLTFQIDSHFKGQDLKIFLQTRILKMAQVETAQTKSESSLWKFLSYLSLAIKELPETQEDILGFVEGYMKFSTVLNPVRPHQYILHRNYSNGVDSVPAKHVEPTEVGEIVERRLKEVQVLEAQKKRAFELRQPVLKPVAQSLTEIIKKDSLPKLESHYNPGTEAVLPPRETHELSQPKVFELRFQMDQIHRGGKPADDEFEVKLLPKESLHR